MLLADKVLKQLGKEKAKEKYKVFVHFQTLSVFFAFIFTLNFFFLFPKNILLQNREPMMPSPQFIKSYFSSFTDDIISQPLQKGEKKDEDKDKEGEAAEVSERLAYLLNPNFFHNLRFLLLQNNVKNL